VGEELLQGQMNGDMVREPFPEKRPLFHGADQT
jgi:hypothetical protein